MTTTKEGEERKEGEEESGTHKFVIPSIQEIQRHMELKGCHNCVHESNQFWNYYDSIDWYVGKKKMKRWKSAASRWVGNSKKVKNIGAWD